MEQTKRLPRAQTRLTLVRTCDLLEFKHMLTSTSGPDHQRIAKIDRENEVAPPPKVPLTVGKVRFSHVHQDDVFTLFTTV